MHQPNWATPSFSALLGFEAIKNSGKSFNASDQDFPVEQEELIFIGNGIGIKAVSRKSMGFHWHRFSAGLVIISKENITCQVPCVVMVLQDLSKITNGELSILCQQVGY